MKRYLCLLLCLVLSMPAISQSSNKYFSVSYLRGPVYDHRDLAGVLDFSITQGVGAEYLFDVSGSKPWHSNYRAPKLGVAAYYEDFGNSQLLGYGLSGAIVSQFFIIKRSAVCAAANLQVGAAYVSKTFDARTNYTNLLVGAHLSAFFRMGVELQILPSHRISPLIGANFVHYSNGSMKLPNLGLNLAQFNLGARVRINKDPVGLDEKSTPVLGDSGSRRFRYQATVSFGCREQGNPEGEKYLVAVLNAKCMREVSRKWVLGLGIDVIRDGSDVRYFNKNSLPSSQKDYISTGIQGSGAMMFGKCTAGIEVGVTVLSPKNKGSMYDRVSVDYHITRNLLAHVGLKTYLMKAEFIEWGFGYAF